jgi:hypothetical protein
VKTRTKQRLPSTPTEVAKEPPSKPAQPDRRYVDLPEDEDFVVERPSRRLGFFARRRMLREGLLSPNFVPPE